MAKLANLPSKHVIDGFKGKIDYYVYMGIPCARAWPRSPGHARAPAVQAQWPSFSFAGSYWDSLSLAVKEAYATMVGGQPVTGRDFFTKSFISGDTIRIE